MPLAAFAALAAASLTTTAPLVVTPDMLAPFASVPVSLDDHGTIHQCEGPLLSEVVATAGVPQGQALRGAALAQGVRVVARDGYAVLLGLGEIDPLLGKSRAVLALRCDGAPLDDALGPVRLVIEGDGRPARAVRQVDRIELVGAAGD